MENQLSKKTKVDSDEALTLESDSVSSSLGDECINSIVDNSNNIAVNEISTCTSSALDSGGICNLEKNPKLSKKQRMQEKIIKKRAQVAANFKNDPEKKRAQVTAHFNKDPEKKRAQVRAHFNKDPEKKRAQVRAHFNKDPEKKRAQVRAHFNKDSEKKRAQVRAHFNKDPENKRAQVKAHFQKNPEKKQAQVRANFNQDRALKRMRVQMHYYKNQFQITSNKKAKYLANPYKKRLAAALYAKAKRLCNPLLKKRQNRAYYRKRYDKIRAARKSRYILRKPKKIEIFRYLRKLKLQLRVVETQVVYHFQNNYPFAKKLSSTAL